MKIVILGSRGMLGSTLSKYLKSQNHEIINVARNYPCDFICNIEAQEELEILAKFIINSNIDVVINCIGLLIKGCELNPERAIYVNSYFPHYLEKVLSNTSVKLIHISTDYIFDGKEGNYNENSIPTQSDWYGRSKAMGEIINNKDLTIRTSFVGTEQKKEGNGLFEWVLRQQDAIKGFSKEIWNGVTTLELAKFINSVILTKKDLNLLYQLVSPHPISKMDLISLICEVWNKRIEIIPDITLKSNKTLINNRLREFNYKVPSYLEQLEELYKFDNQKENK